MPSLDGTVQDRHHHALPGVASPPGPSDGERRQAACGAVPAPLRGKEEGRWRQRGLGGGVNLAPSVWVRGSVSGSREQDEGRNRLTSNRPDWGRPEVLLLVLAECSWRVLGSL